MKEKALPAKKAPESRQFDIYFNPHFYSAFPQLLWADDGDLIISFRQAPWEGIVRHTHPTSLITIARSSDQGRSWEFDHATQIGAGGGQELALMRLGKHRIAGALAKHNVVSRPYSERACIPLRSDHENASHVDGTYWVSSNDDAFTWPLGDMRKISPLMPCAPPILTHKRRILLPVYGKRSRSDKSNSSLLLISADQGRSWSRPKLLASGTRAYRMAEPALVAANSERLVAMHRIVYNTKAWQKIPAAKWTYYSQHSENGGRTWSPAKNTGIVGGSAPRLMRLSDGRLLFTFGRRFKPYGIRAMPSEDEGLTWGKCAWKLRDMPNGNMGYTSSVELGDGRMLTVSYGENRRGVTGITGTTWRLPH